MKYFVSASARVAATLVALFALLAQVRADAPSVGAPFDSYKTYSLTLPKGALTPTSLSVAAWVKTSDPSESQGVLDVGAPSRGFTFYLYKDGFRFIVEENVETGAYATVRAPLPEKDVWTHYCGTYDGKTIRVYKNGKLAGSATVETNLPSNAFDGQKLWIGAVEPRSARPFVGEMNDLAIWSKPLAESEVATLFARGAGSLPDSRVALWNETSAIENGEKLAAIGAKASDPFVATRVGEQTLLNAKDSGYRGIWYYNQKLQNEYVFKYSGGLGTYPANHYPFSVYRPEVDKTFFCYGGTDPGESTLWHEVGVYDHKTKKVSRPTILLDKETEDAHDNPVTSVDDEGRIWVFSTSHGTGRPSYIHRSVRPYDISEFEKVDPTKLVDGSPVPMTNFSYVQIWNVPQRGFFSLFTTYDRRLVAEVDPNSKAQRLLALMSSADGVSWSAWKPLAAIEIGHYQNARVFYDLDKKAGDGKPSVKIGTSFNYHPAVAKGNRGTGLNWRTNLYYMESDDLGATWKTVDGTVLKTPLLDSNNPAKIYDYESENLNVYITDLQYDPNGYPIIAYVTSKGFESGPEMGPRIFRVARWIGDKWEFSDVCQVDNNYELGMIYPEEAKEGVLRLIGSFEDGPQAYNTGGEISQWVSRDNGKTWKKEFQLTEKSAVNQCFPRRTIDASPEFYAFWAEGNGREKSISTLRFSTKDGKIYALPREMKEDWESPIEIRQAPKLN
ncbi:MAG: BNR-4 repeat-containing protein [Thermoguttaceae bacterium]|nr:BNR-4 repeat-containing protein [Thermoguttaceae bacterium]